MKSSNAATNAKLTEDKEENMPAMQKRPSDFARTKTYLSSSDRRQANQAWEVLLDAIQQLATGRTLKTLKVFISYAWETDSVKNDKLQAWLKKLQNDLQAVGMQVFFDLSDMSGKLDQAMSQNIQESDFILPIITPRFLERAKDTKSNLGLEYRESLKKAETNPKCFIPLIYDGQFDFRTSFTGDLAKIPQFLMKDFKRVGDYQRNLVTLRPLGLIPEMLGIRIGHKEYQSFLDHWHETSLTRLPPSNPDFSGREDLFEKLHQGFNAAAQSRRDPVQVIVGLGGVGKTQLALEFAHRYQNNYDFVCWLNADKEVLYVEFLRLAENLNIDTKGLELSDVQKKVHDALAKFSSWLLIFDNATNPQALQGYLPKQHSAMQHVLITSRSAKWPQAKLTLSTFNMEESVQYTQHFLPDTTVSECEQLATALGHLPLALSHAVAYIAQTGYTIAQYLRRYQESGLQLLAKNPQTTKTATTEVKSDEEADDDFNYKQTVLTTWQLSLTQIQQRSKDAERCLMLCGYLHADGITEDILKKALKIEGTALDDLILVLRDYSMITVTESGFKIHRLVQGVIQWRDKSPQAAGTDKMIDIWKERLKPLADTLYDLYPFKKQTADYAKTKQLQPHLETVVEHLAPFANPIKNQKETAAVAQGNLYAALGDLFRNVLVNPKKAVEYYEKVLRIYLATYGDSHPGVATSYNLLGQAHQNLGDAKKAVEYFEKALRIYLATYGDSHPDVATSYGNLGQAYKDLGNAKKAVEYFEKALRIYLATYGDSHPDVATSYGNLGQAYKDLGNAKKAVEYFEKALRIYLATYGDSHPDVATSYSNLGSANQDLGDAKKAIEYYEKALKIRLATYGDQHPSVATSYNNLGRAHKNLGDAKKAIEYYEKDLKISLATFGDQHPDVATSYNNLGLAYQDLGDAKKAIEYFEKALKIKLATYGDQHPSVATSYNNLGSAYKALGDAKKAIEYYEKALKIRLATYGDQHPSVATSYNNLGLAYQDLGDAKKAIEYYEKALKIRLATYGDQHPSVATSYNNLGLAYQDLGDAKKAIEYFEKALKIKLATYGDQHLSVATSYNNLGLAYKALGDAKKAIEYYEKALKIKLATYDDLHPAVATSYNNLGSAYQDLGDAKKAIEYYEKALKIKLATYDDLHPAVATSYNNLGSAYQALGDAKKAIEYYEKALKIILATYGDQHPDVATSYNNLGLAYQALGDAKKAIEYFEKALKIRLATYDDLHPAIATSYNNLGSPYQDLGDEKKAIEYYEKALKIRLATYGDLHPVVAISYNNLGLAYQALGDAKKAIEYFEKAHKIKLATYDDLHPYVAISYKNLGNAYNDLNNSQTAMNYFEKALKIFLTAFNDIHPRVAQTYNGMGNAYRISGDLQLAIECHQKALKIQLDKYPEKHIEVAASYHDLGKDYLALKDREKALFHFEKALSIYSSMNPEHPKIVKVKMDLEAVQQLQSTTSQAIHPSTMFGARAQQASRDHQSEQKADALNVDDDNSSKLKEVSQSTPCCVML